ncbi:hypothetical protein GY45DRAFT_1339676 [Cubamyces sp. BRFM 1775]|nr:hypothetical protein GY45DRAFT_1339676 [Cubamyces sp. BRFM 1775]
MSAKNDTPAKSTKHSGRQPGSANYTEGDLRALFKCVRAFLPMSQEGWKKVGKSFGEWAEKHGRPHREWNTLKNKYDAIYRQGMEKPTGSAEVPWYIEEVLDIERSIEERSYIQELDDGNKADLGQEDGVDGSDDVIEVDGSSSSDVELVSQENGKKSKGGRKSSQPVLRAVRNQAPAAASSSRSSSRRSQVSDLLTTISASLDPATREAREEARFAQKLVHEEIKRLRQENRDLSNRNNALNDRNQQLLSELHDQKTEVMRLQARLETYEMMHMFMGRGPTSGNFSQHSGRHTSSTPQHVQASNSRSHHSDVSDAPALQTLASVASGSGLNTGREQSPETAFTITVSPSRRRQY